MEVEYKKKALEDREYWKQQNDLKIQNRISELR
jgi:Txe/YoeB family toxin of Txe-Axe toxin-antitoxin module